MCLEQILNQQLSLCSTGWGSTSGGQFLPNSLQWIQIPIHSYEECDEIFPESITSGMVCAGGPGAATCMVIIFPFPDLQKNREIDLPENSYFIKRIFSAKSIS